MKNAVSGSFFDKLPPSLIKKNNVTLIPEGAIGYLLGPTLALLANSVLSNYFNKYMSDVLHINNWASAFFTWLPVISVIFVVLGNILVGRLMDKIRSKNGKARPLLLVSVPISLLALLFLFVFSPYNADNTQWHTGALICIAIGYNLWFAFAYPMYYTPHAALVSLSTRNGKDRGLLATISNATMLAAMGLSSMILPFFLNLLFVYDMSGKGTAVTNSAGVIQYYVDESGAAIYDAQASYAHWKIFVIALIIITFIGALIEYFFTRERVTEETMSSGASGEEKKALPLKAQAKICLHDKFWIIMMVFFFLYQFGGMIKNVSQNYFCTAMFADALGNYTVAYGGEMQGLLAIIGAIPTAIGMVIALPLANALGSKAKAILCGAVVAVIGGAIGMFAPDNFVIVTVSFIVKALGSTPAMYLSLALLADIFDHQEAVHGVRTDGLSMTIYGAIMAGMTGLTTGVLNMVLSGVHYDVSTLQTNDALRAAMPWVFIGGETICYLGIFLIFLFMGVEKFSKIDHHAIVADQKAAAAAEGREYISAEEKIRREEGEEAYQAELKKQSDAAQKEQARIARLSDARRQAEAEAEAKLLESFNALRKAAGRSAVEL
ncbi:MAG: MFS transporter [Oscillospiraceae bacterium]|nr:MFS transporter [Oscillospiraceae bacterium]